MDNVSGYGSLALPNAPNRSGPSGPYTLIEAAPERIGHLVEILWTSLQELVH